ncbi:hypothetical protein, partial [Sansalvadorimonas verongulae]|uniref:hypothetical protein n=1 Tax=Sansalvadorimonas verongulae TaxID=2172824 RepID=UPI0018AD24A4
FEKKLRVKDASEHLEQMTEDDAETIGIFAAILDLKRYQPTRLLADILVTDNGLAFNDFGYDLGDVGPETQTYYGHDIPTEYNHGQKCLKRDLKKHPQLLNSALASYENHKKKLSVSVATATDKTNDTNTSVEDLTEEMDRLTLSKKQSRDGKNKKQNNDDGTPV